MNNYFKLIGVLTLGMALYSCGGDRNNQSGETTTPVWVDDVRQRTIEEFITTTGTAKATRTVELKSETNGDYVLQTNPKTGKPYQLGDIVEAGAVIDINAKLELENAYITLGKMSVKAPFKGVIVSLPYYTPNVEVASAQPVVG